MPVGNIQIINGVPYTMYSPAWYAAQQAEAQRASTAEGTAAGSKLAAASASSGLPLPGATGASGGTSSSANISAGAGGAGAHPSTIPSPAVNGLTAAIGGGVQMPTAPGGAGGGAAHAHIAPVDTSAAESASFNTAKDQVGQESAGALTGLRSALGGRGLLGSGIEGRATADAATSAASELGAVSRQQAVTRADEAQKNAATNFAGDVTQRGQDFQHEEAGNSLAGSLAEAGYSGQITQRGQDIQNANAQKALEIEQAQLGAQQRSTALAGLEAALKTTSPGMY